MRLAVVGCGYWGINHIRVYRTLLGPGSIAAADVDPAGLDRVRRMYPDVRLDTDLERLLPAVDAVVIATPPRTHAALARTSLLAGCHVLIEKPMACSVAEAEDLISRAERAGLTLMSGHTFEYNPAVWKLRELVASGDLGEICHVDASRLNLGRYQSDVNVFWDLAPHDISILNYVLGSAPTEVTAWGRHNEPVALEDVGCLRLEYGRIAVSAQVNVSWLDPRKVRQITVVGHRKMAIYDDLKVDERVKVFDKGIKSVTPEPGFSNGVDYRYGGTEAPYIDFREPLMIEGEEFVKAIATGEKPRADGESGLAVVRVLEAADRSLASRRPEAIDGWDDERTGAGSAVVA